MPNTLLTPSIIAREALMVLENNLVFAGLVHRDYSEEFAKVGDTITVRKPATFTAQEFSSSITVQDATETSVSVKLDKHLDVSFAVTAQDLTLKVADFSEQFIAPAMRALAQKVDSYIAGLYVDVPYKTAVSGTPVVGDLAAIGKLLNQAKSPLTDRRLVLDPITHAKYVVLDAFLHAEKSGTTEALRNASMGKVLGLESYMSQNIVSHVKGTLDAAATGTGSLGATEVTVASGGASKTVKKGDIVTFADTAGVYVCTEDMTTDGTGAGTLKIYPALAAAVSAKTITLLADHIANLAFHKNAFALVTRPLEKPLGASRAEAISYRGLTIRAVYDYDITTKKDTISLDLLCGVKTLTPELAVRFVG